MRKASNLGIAIILIGVLFGLISLWWWALFGLSVDVGIASVVTAIALCFGGLIIYVGETI